MIWRGRGQHGYSAGRANGDGSCVSAAVRASCPPLIPAKPHWEPYDLKSKFHQKNVFGRFIKQTTKKSEPTMSFLAFNKNCRYRASSWLPGARELPTHRAHHQIPWLEPGPFHPGPKMLVIVIIDKYIPALFFYIYLPIMFMWSCVGIDINRLAKYLVIHQLNPCPTYYKQVSLD